jgi:putative acetyltransferase
LDAFDISECTVQDPALTELLHQANLEFNRRYPESNGQRRGPLLPDIRFLIARRAGVAVGCCALQKGGELSVDGAYEAKRLFVVPAARGSGAASALMNAVETLAASIGAEILLAETGTRQPEVIRILVRLGYVQIAPYPPYLDDPLAQCFCKNIARRLSVSHLRSAELCVDTIPICGMRCVGRRDYRRRKVVSGVFVSLPCGRHCAQNLQDQAAAWLTYQAIARIMNLRGLSATVSTRRAINLRSGFGGTE